MADDDILTIDPSLQLGMPKPPRAQPVTIQDLTAYLRTSGSTPSPPSDSDTGSTGALATGKGNRVDARDLYSYLQGKFANSGLVGYVPPDGERWGITKGTASEWAAFGLAVAKQESDFDTRSYNAADPGGSIGLFQFGEGQTQFTKGTNQFDPQNSADAFVRSVQHYVGRNGNIANLGATFGSIRRPNEAGQYIPYAQRIAAGSSGKAASGTSQTAFSAPVPRDGNNPMVDLTRYLSSG